MLVLTRAETESVLDPERLRGAVACAMEELSAGRVSMPIRTAALVAEHDGLLGVMAAYIPELGAFGAKLVTLFPHNDGEQAPTHQAVVVAFDPATGTPAALLDGASITAERTAAGSALSVELLSRPESRTLAILGTGVQARSHARAVTRVRQFTQIRVAGRTPERVAALAAELRETLRCDVVEAPSFAEACAGADVICATTHALDPIVVRAHIAPGTHIASVGFNATGREVDSDTVAASLLVVESRDSVLAPPPSGSNDIRTPIDEGRISADHIHAEIGELVAGSRPGRTAAEQITLYKSVGVAVQDVAAAALALDAARGRGLGVEVAL